MNMNDCMCVYVNLKGVLMNAREFMSFCVMLPGGSLIVNRVKIQYSIL